MAVKCGFFSSPNCSTTYSTYSPFDTLKLTRKGTFRSSQCDPSPIIESDLCMELPISKEDNIFSKSCLLNYNTMGQSKFPKRYKDRQGFSMMPQYLVGGYVGGKSPFVFKDFTLNPSLSALMENVMNACILPRPVPPVTPPTPPTIPIKVKQQTFADVTRKMPQNISTSRSDDGWHCVYDRRKKKCRKKRALVTAEQTGNVSSLESTLPPPQPIESYSSLDTSEPSSSVCDTSIPSAPGSTCDTSVTSTSGSTCDTSIPSTSGTTCDTSVTSSSSDDAVAKLRQLSISSSTVSDDSLVFFEDSGTPENNVDISWSEMESDGEMETDQLSDQDLDILCGGLCIDMWGLSFHETIPAVNYMAECASDDLTEVNERWKKQSSRVTEKKKTAKVVHFAPDKSLSTVHTMVTWSYAYRAARCGPWERYARDRCRFMHRIEEEYVPLLSPVLTEQHREKDVLMVPTLL